MNSTTSPSDERVTRSKSSAGEWSGTPSVADSSSFVTVGSTVCVPPTIVIVVPAHEQVVERVLLQVAGGEARDERRANVQELDRHRIAVGEAKTLDRDDRLGRRDMEDAAEPGTGGDLAQVERAAAGREPARSHVVAERGDVDALGDLRLGDERAGAAPAHEVSLAHELVERGAHGET